LSDQSIDDFEFDGRSLRRKARATEEPHAS
jgi:hypothetical protein